MKQFYGITMAAMGGMIGLGSCSQGVLNDGWDMDSTQHKLRVTTRSDVPVDKGVVYLMDDSGTCLAKLETDAQGGYVATSLLSGAYDVYAVGSNDLEGWALPSQEEATSDSRIGWASDQHTGDLLTGHERVSLTDGQMMTLDLQLERKVICVKEVSIREVPADVTSVSVAIEPIYGHVLLDGHFEDQDTTYWQVTLTPEGETGTWHYTGDMFAFPSKGKPRISITFERGESVDRYRYLAEEPLMSNRQLRITGTYSDVQASDHPIAGQSWQNYFVVSVDETAHTAVLLRRTYERGINSAERMMERAQQIRRPEGAISNAWRLPTEAECRTFLMATNIGDIDENDDIIADSYYYQEGSKVGRMLLRIKNGQRTLVPFPGVGYSDVFIYRPVIDVSW